MFSKCIRCLLLLVLCCGITSMAAEKRAITFEDFFSMKRVGALTASPDGKHLAYTLKIADIEQNSFKTDIWIMNLSSGESTQFTSAEKSSTGPVWAPDGKAIYFDRDGQIWRKTVSGGEAVQVTDFVAGASGAVLHPAGEHLLFKADIYAECETEECLESRFKEEENRKSSGRVIDHLFYRHWNSWREGKHRHVFLADTNGNIIRDVTPGPYDSPALALGSGKDYVFSPDGKEICFVRNTDEIVAASTNNDLFITGTDNGTIKRLTTNKGNDNHPVYSPDGRYLAYRSMKRPGFEADRYRIMLYNRNSGSTKELTKDFSLSASSITWHPGSGSIFFTTDESGMINIYSVDINSSKITPVLKGHYVHDLNFVSGREIVFRKQSASSPDEIFRMDLKKKRPEQLSFINNALLAGLELPSIESFTFKGAKGEEVEGFLMKPPFFDPNKTYPAIELIHGGPQGAWGDEFHYRWNYQMFAAPGYVLFMINFHGSTGYGQEFKDAVSKDWGGAPYKDIVLGTEYVLENYPFIDRNRVAAAGASYGGFMVNWIAGHENPFKCLVSHDGVYEQVSMYGATEELWFPEWEFNGTPWEEGSLYQKWSPANLASNFKTPMLVIHGEKDYRVPYTQGLQLFTALQRQGVKSRLLYFPDEDHFVQKPQNAKLWWETVHDWIAEFVR